MNDSVRISMRCTRIAQMVDAPVRDQTILLLAARMLKALHGDLTRAAWQHVRLAGRTASSAETTHALTSAEQYLRPPPLEYAALPPAHLRDVVARALAERRHGADPLDMA